MDEEQEKQTVEEPETQEPETKEEPVAQEEPVEDKFNVQVINLLQELCDTVKALKVEEAQEEVEEEAEDASQFDELLDE